jgi:hypothetical protein
MPELPVKEGRLPELRLPEISRDEIIRSFSEIRRPDMDLSHVEWPKVDFSHVEWPKVDLPHIEWTREDLDKAILGLAVATRLVRPAVRSRRLPLSLGFLAVAGLATFALLSRPAVRDRLARTAREARRRAQEARGGPEILEVEADVPFEHEGTTAIAIPIEPQAFTDAADVIAEVAEKTEVTQVAEKAAEPA